MRRTQLFFIAVFILGAIFAPVFAPQLHSEDIQKLIVFHSPTCHKCIEAKQELIPEIEKKFKGYIEIEYRDMSSIENYMFLFSLREKHKSDIEIVPPVFYLEGNFLNGKGDLKNELGAFILNSIPIFPEEGSLSGIDLVGRFKNFRPLAVISAALIDGINPCAFTVIVFFISFLALQGYRKRELIIIGLSFISVVFITYLLIGLGIFNFLYRLKGFWLVTRVFNISIGVLSIILGILAVYDLIKWKRTGETDGLLLQLPPAVKNRIHNIIGLHYRKSKGGQAEIARPQFFRLFTSALVTGFLVSILEAICTGQVYLPTITFVLKTTSLKMQALGYLVLYNLMFIVPLLAIFLLALLGVTSEQFSKFLKSRLSLIKVLMAILFFSLGIFLIWRA